MFPFINHLMNDRNHFYTSLIAFHNYYKIPFSMKNSLSYRKGILLIPTRVLQETILERLFQRLINTFNSKNYNRL